MSCAAFDVLRKPFNLPIGVLVGVGFYGAAILLSVLSASLMMWGGKLEAKLEARWKAGNPG